VAHVFRRYSHRARYDVLEHMNVEYTWFQHLRTNGFDPYVIYGAPASEHLEFANFNCALIKDLVRKSPLHHSANYYRDAKIIIREKKISILHLHNVLDVLSAIKLKNSVGIQTPILIQDHGSVPQRKHAIYSPLFKKIDGFLFNSLGQELPWTEKKLIRPDQCYFAPEGTSNFTSDGIKEFNRSEIRLISIGNLIEGKDPMTILKGLKLIVSRFPQVKLTMIYMTAPLYSMIVNYVKQEKLDQNVEFIGQVPHDAIEHYLRKSHIYVSASHKEGSGYGAIEAMSCGLIPILSDIPSFRDFTDHGTAGRLFKRSDHVDFAEKTLSIMSSDLANESQRVLSRYHHSLSPEALGRSLAAVYEEVISKSKTSHFE